jgi:hypothetical protein
MIGHKDVRLFLIQFFPAFHFYRTKGNETHYFGPNLAGVITENAFSAQKATGGNGKRGQYRDYQKERQPYKNLVKQDENVFHATNVGNSFFLQKNILMLRK